MAISKIENCSDLLSLVTYVDKLKSIIKKDFSLSFEEFAVLTYINDTDEEEYHLKLSIKKFSSFTCLFSDSHQHVVLCPTGAVLASPCFVRAWAALMRFA